MKDSFYTYHPIVNILFFGEVIVFAMIFTHPLCHMLSLVAAMSYSIYLKGSKQIRFSLVFMLPMLLMAALINPIFNHEGATILAFLPSGNPLTLESVIYGIFAAIMLIGVLFWFTCFNEVITSDKLVYLFGRIIPALSLILSMSLRFVPLFTDRIKVVARAQKNIGKDVSKGNMVKRAGNAVKILSVVITWSLENAVETSDSMRSRGYGTGYRTAFSIFRFTIKDIRALIFLLVCGGIVALSSGMGLYAFRYYPTIKGTEISLPVILAMAVYGALCFMPMMINIREDLIWKDMTSKV